MKTFSTRILFLALLGSAASATAQETRTKENRVVPAFETFAADAGLSPQAYFNYQKQNYSLPAGTQFVLSDSAADRIGMVHYRYRQTCKGRPVEGAMLLLHTKNGLVQSANGDVFPILNPETAPAISEAAALKKALETVPAQLYAWEHNTKGLYKQTAPPAGELVWAPEGGKPTGRFVLAYKFDVYALKPLKKSFVFISAANGSVVCEKPGLMDVHVTGKATTKYSGVRYLTTDSVSPGYYVLEDETRGGGIATVDMQNTTSSYVDCANTTNVWGPFSGARGAEYDVHWGLQRVYDYYDTVHNRNSFDNAGGMMVGLVHYDVDFANAFWNGSAMFFGDGSTTYGMKPLTSLDVVAHEATHAVTQYTANLDYNNESGALNESFSDIFGKSVENRYKLSTFTWNIGKEIMISAPGMRNMANPKLAMHPDTYFGSFWYIGPNDHGGVHSNSGVQNFWFYLLAVGKSGTNDNNTPYTVTGIGMDKAAAIAYRNLTTYLTPYSTYADASAGSVQSAKDLFGTCSNEAVQTINAWAAVGLGNPYPVTSLPKALSSVPATIYAGEGVQFTSSSTNFTNIAWYVNSIPVGNGNPQSYTFNVQGNQTVTLVAENAQCTDTARKQVFVNPPLAIGSLPAGVAVRVYPNPANSGAYLEGTAQGTVKYQLTDVTGRVLRENHFTASGTYQEPFSTAGLAAGMYQLSVTVAGQTQTLQVTVAH